MNYSKKIICELRKYESVYPKCVFLLEARTGPRNGVCEDQVAGRLARKARGGLGPNISAPGPKALRACQNTSSQCLLWSFTFLECCLSAVLRRIFDVLLGQSVNCWASPFRHFFATCTRTLLPLTYVRQTSARNNCSNCFRVKKNYPHLSLLGW